MDIIESWVDESKVRSMAMQLLEPAEESKDGDGEFVIISPEDIFVERQNSRAEGAGISENLEGGEAQINATIGQSPQSNAIKSLQAAAQKAAESGIVKTQSSKIAGLNTGQGKRKNIEISAELQQHLGEAAGALSNRGAVTSSLEKIKEVVKAEWDCKELSISDRDGDIFVDTLRSPAWTRLTVSVTEPICLLDIKQGAIGHGYMHLKVSAKEFLQIVVTSTSHGLLIFGMIKQKQLNAEEVVKFVAKVRELVG